MTTLPLQRQASLACLKRLVWLPFTLWSLAASPLLIATEDRTYTEEREACDQYSATKRPLFGDLHIHSRLSFDSYLSSQRNGPDEVYEYAKGLPITVPGADGEQTVIAQIDRPLDFAALTDHGEFLGQVEACQNPDTMLGKLWPMCMMSRSQNLWVQLLAASWWTSLGGQTESEPTPSSICLFEDCDANQINVWQDVQTAAERHYDRSSNCSFTSFVGYEYTDAINQNNLHRNVIFRNDNVTDAPISVYETRKSVLSLWQQLNDQCINGDKGCDVLAIPHNSNLSGGLMFKDPKTPEELKLRRSMEPLVELVQHKGASECRYDRLTGRGVDTTDELCDFEQIPSDNLHMLGTVEGEMRSESGQEVPIDQFAPRTMIRNVLKDGVALRSTLGANPFQFGFIGSTDTHSATAGGAQEQGYVGHLGRRDSEYRNVQDHFVSNPGGHAVVWAEENSRDAIFEAMRRRETYATSGTRPTVRFFGGNYPADACKAVNRTELGYQQGVPMGGVIESKGLGETAQFLVYAQKDAGTLTHPGYDLQRIQIIKGWADADGKTHEQVFEVAGNPNNGASVDPNSCAAVGTGYSELCTVWEDPNFDPEENAFYYARVVENPSCRWSTLQCMDAGVNPFSDQCQEQSSAASQKAREQQGATGEVYKNCCRSAENEAFYSPVIQERAWTSPIWIQSAL